MHLFARVFSVISLALAASVSGSLQAQVILLDPGTANGSTTAHNQNAGPYPTADNVTWNRANHNTAWGTALVYSDGTAIPGTFRVYVDALSNITGGANYSFGGAPASPIATGSVNNGGAGIFGTLTEGNPYKDAVYGSVATNVGYGGVGMRVTGLAYGTYDIYVSSAYVGATSNGSKPEESTPAQFNVWGYAGEGTGFEATTAPTGVANLGTPNAIILNTEKDYWAPTLNYALLTVTIDASNPALYIISENRLNGAEDRGWLNAVQIVAVPEPTSMMLLAGTLGLLGLRRRHRR